MSRSKTLTFQMAEVAVPLELFAAILERIDRCEQALNRYEGDLAIEEAVSWRRERR